MPSTSPTPKQSSSTPTTIQTRHVNNTMTQQQQQTNVLPRVRGRRESRPITSIATTTANPSLMNTTNSGGGKIGGNNNNNSPAATRTEDTTFSLPIDIIDTPDLDELCLSPVNSAPTSRPPSPLSSTPVLPPRDP